MSDCDTIKPKLPGLLRQELAANDLNEVQTHIGRCSSCRAYLLSLSSANADDPAISAHLLPQSTSNSRGYALILAIALTLLIGSYIAMTGHGLVAFIQDSDEPVFLRVAAMILVLTVSVLFVSVAYERYLSRKNDPYQEVEQ